MSNPFLREVCEVPNGAGGTNSAENCSRYVEDHRHDGVQVQNNEGSCECVKSKAVKAIYSMGGNFKASSLVSLRNEEVHQSVFEDESCYSTTHSTTVVPGRGD